ncbi:hypothetical protein [Rhizobium sp.]
MTLLERIKTLVFGKDMPPPVFDDSEIEERRNGGYQNDGASRPAVSTPVDDPAMDDVAAAGTQPVSKPWEIEEAQNPPRKPVPPMN